MAPECEPRVVLPVRSLGVSSSTALTADSGAVQHQPGMKPDTRGAGSTAQKEPPVLYQADISEKSSKEAESQTPEHPLHVQVIDVLRQAMGALLQAARFDLLPREIFDDDIIRRVAVKQEATAPWPSQQHSDPSHINGNTLVNHEIAEEVRTAMERVTSRTNLPDEPEINYMKADTPPLASSTKKTSAINATITRQESSQELPETHSSGVGEFVLVEHEL